MSSNHILVSSHLLNAVHAIALNAGKKIIEIYNTGDMQTEYKSDQSPLTAADIASHHTIITGLQQLNSEIPVLSEESTVISYKARKHWQQFWLVDPLDGTKEFLKRNGEFTVNIALIQNGIPVLGVVHAPASGLSYFAAQGIGAYKQQKNNSPLAIHAEPYQPNTPCKIVASRSHGDTRQEQLLNYLGGVSLDMGSSLKLCMVAEGSAHLYPRLGPTMEWDTAAAHCIVTVAGGIVCDMNGISLHYNKPDLHNTPFIVLAALDKLLLKKIIEWHNSSLTLSLIHI
jgi:3'(2'), 5'-bisphosphate nucleotidase